jgi:putative hydrolase of the HAD superfamily
MLKAIFFDLDGTLAEDGDSIQEALEGACRIVENCWPELNRVDLAAVYRQISDTAWGDYDRYLRHLPTPEAMLAAVWQQTLAHWNLHDSEIEDEAAHVYWRHRLHTCRPYPDALPVLQFLADRIPLSVLTNGAPAMQRAKLDATGLAPFFHRVFVGGEFARGKPDRAIFRAALAAAGCRPDQAIHIGDSLTHDIRGAHTVGIRGVWINRKNVTPADSSPVPDFAITTLEQLVEYVEHLRTED